MIKESIDLFQAIGEAAKEPEQGTLVAFAMTVAPIISFIGVQRIKRVYYYSGIELTPLQLDRLAWVLFCFVCILLMKVLYWGTPSEVPWRVVAVMTFMGSLVYIATVSVWMDVIKITWPTMYNRLRTKRRTSDNPLVVQPEEPRMDEEMAKVKNLPTKGDPDQTYSDF